MCEYYELKDNRYGCKTLTVYSDGTYAEIDKKLLKVIDNGNGYTIKDYSWTTSTPDTYYNIGYALAQLLYDNLGLLLHEEHEQ